MIPSLYKTIVILFVVINYTSVAQLWNPNLNEEKYQNPIIWADYSDPDIVKVGDEFFMTASSFNCVPALPILHSRDLVNWKLVNYAVKRFGDQYFDTVQHGNGVWAPSIRYHDGWFYIYWGDPDRGIFMVKSDDPLSDWSEPILVKKAYGNIDPCPLWDEDGKLYLVHAFANSRAGVSHILQVQELTPDGTGITKNRNVVINGYPENHTLEGPKFYKRNDYYYIFAPAGGVKYGWQMVYRAQHPFGPYEGKRILEQGSTNINGPHQGGWVALNNGENWFVHFQEHQPFGRIVHLQPMIWEDDWPIMGIDHDANGIGEPVLEYQKPNLPVSSFGFSKSDEFSDAEFNIEWQWQANYYASWFSLSENKGYLRLYSLYHPEEKSLFTLPNVLAQKIPGPEFSAITKFDISNIAKNEETGIVMMGLDYASISVKNKNGRFSIEYAICSNARQGNSEKIISSHLINSSLIWFKVDMNEDGLCYFSYSVNGINFVNLPKSFQAREGRWIGAKIGLYAVSNNQTAERGYTDIDWFRFE